jgi:putative ABC transport system permease protein
MKHNHPPRLAEWFLAVYCRPELLEDLQGDLNEYFERNCQTKGVHRAKLIYFIDVIKFLRPYTIAYPKFLNLLIHYLMIGSYIKTSGRNIVRNKLFSFINIFGLAISMSVGLLLIGLLSDMYSYDKFHKNKERIYRVISKYEYLGKADAYSFGSTSLKAGKLIQETIPGIDEAAVMRRGLQGDVKHGETVIPLEGLWANNSFFNVFTFPLLEGDVSTALKDPFSLILTEESSKKLFGTTEAVGKTVSLLDKDYTVTGIAKDVPRFSHIKFDMLASLNSREANEKDVKRDAEWDNIWSGYVYLLLSEDANLKTIQENLNKLTEREDKTVEKTKIYLSLQHMSQIALGEDMSNPIGPTMDIKTIWIIGGLALVVIISACFNYTNLSIARAMRRTREVGIRKVIGALKSHVLFQFVVEAVIIALLAVVFSFGLFILLKPYFLGIDPKLQRMLTLDLSPQLIFYFVLLAVGVGAAAGFFPALFFARINAIQTLKSSSNLRVFKNVNLRKTLVIAQYTISLMFIAATLIGYKQYKHILSFDLGFTTENIFNIDLQGNKPDLLRKELAEIPEVKELSNSIIITSVGNYWGTRMKYTDPLDSVSVHYNQVDENYLPLHGHKFIAGRNFTPLAEGAEESEVIVNEKVLKRFNIGNRDPLKALGEEVTVDKKKLKIVGVLKDFHYGTLQREMREVIFRYSNKDANYVNVKLVSSDLTSTLPKLEKAWKKIDKVHPYAGAFYDDEIANAYNDFSSMLKVVGFLAVLAICISSMGLLGMVVFTTETRLKEVSIRKVMGATEFNLIYLLSKSFLILLAVAAFIALPATYFFFDKVALAEIVYHAPINMSELFLGVIIVMIIAFIMISSQTLKAARTNPAQVLKNE